MSFDNDYPNRKDKRKKYRGSKQFDASCRCNGGCSYCEGNRMHSTRKQKNKVDQRLKEYKKGED